MGVIYRLTLRQLFGRWRLIIMTVLASLPVLMTVVVLRSRTAPSLQEYETVVFSAMLAGSITPLVVLAIAAAAFANEVEDRTLANLTLAPIARWKIVVPKLLAVITIAAPFIAVSAFVTSYLGFLGDPRATLAVTASALVAVVLYSTAFVWLGLVSTQAIGLGLLYIVLWEGFFSGFVAGVRALSVRHWALDVMHAIDPRRFAESGHLGIAVVAVAGTVACALFVVLAIRRLRLMDVP